MNVEKEIQILHLMALCAELVDGTKRTHKINDRYIMYMMETRASIVEFGSADPRGIQRTIISACWNPDGPDWNNGDVPYMTPNDIYIYNTSACSTFEVYTDRSYANLSEVYDPVLVDLRDPESESTLFQLSTVVSPEVLLGIALHSQVYNYLLPELVHYRRTFIDAEQDYDTLISALENIIEVEHGRE